MSRNKRIDLSKRFLKDPNLSKLSLYEQAAVFETCLAQIDADIATQEDNLAAQEDAQLKKQVEFIGNAIINPRRKK